MLRTETLNQKIRAFGEISLGNYPRSKSNPTGLSSEAEKISPDPGGLPEPDSRRLERRWYGERPLTLNSFVRVWRRRFYTFSERLARVSITSSKPSR